LAVPPEPEVPSLQPEAPPVDLELQQVQQRLMEIEDRIAEVQGQVLGEGGIQEKVDAFQEKLRDRMVAGNPAVEEMIERREALEEELADHPELVLPPEERSDEINAKIQDYQQISMQLSQAEQAAMQDAELAGEREAVEEEILEAMEGIEPDIRAMMEEYEQLIATLQAPGQP